ncbi:hypothetical protein CGCS363_v001355 [Colletotrichum siamense]|uniref:uncharacterized protein n=1 Tax=Colletotrichum siamense TaxID=690259 RepID=UPI0018727A8D|nr:uncharacterized protein CGCS363_v001355 [Colletotrichum siamense]KAF5516061.1 hypothetical protein CGCS363_v001355 [Colletotrichum siamense]
MASSAAEAGGEDSDENIANLSIREICRRFQGERLIVQPLAWTTRHLQLLRCTINELPESSSNASQLQPMPNTPQPSPDIATNWARMVVTRYPDEVASAVGSLLEFYSFTMLSDPLMFCNEKHKIHHPCDIYTGISPCSNGPQLSSVAYVDELNIYHLRCAVLTRRMLWGLPQHENKKAAFTDPYTAALLIAQAQRLRKENALSTRTQDPGGSSCKSHSPYKVQLMKSVHMGVRRNQLWLYTAFVTDAFLDKLAYQSCTAKR